MSPVVILNGGPMDGQRVEVAHEAHEYVSISGGICVPSKKWIPGEGQPLIVVEPAKRIRYRRAGVDHFVFQESE